MAFVKEVTFRVRSVIENLEGDVPYGEAETSDMTLSGFMKQTENGYFLTYAENGEGGRTVSDITTEGNAVTVRRRGGVESEMIFRENIPHTSIYEIPPYRFDMTVVATKIRNTLTLGSGRLDLFYRMTVGGADKKIRLSITAEEI